MEDTPRIIHQGPHGQLVEIFDDGTLSVSGHGKTYRKPLWAWWGMAGMSASKTDMASQQQADEWVKEFPTVSDFYDHYFENYDADFPKTTSDWIAYAAALERRLVSAEPSSA